MADNPGSELEGRYANSFEVGFNAYEFVIDFAQQYEPASGRKHTRIITSPALARGLTDLLEDSLRKFEAMYGEPGLVK